MITRLECDGAANTAEIAKLTQEKEDLEKQVEQLKGDTQISEATQKLLSEAFNRMKLDHDRFQQIQDRIMGDRFLKIREAIKDVK